MSETGPNPEQEQLLHDVDMRFRYLGFYKRIELERTRGLKSSDFKNLRLIARYLADNAFAKAQKAGLGKEILEKQMSDSQLIGEGVYKKEYPNLEEHLVEAESWIGAAAETLLDFDSYDLKRRGQVEAAYERLGDYSAIQFLARIMTKQTITDAVKEKGLSREEIHDRIQKGKRTTAQFIDEQTKVFNNLNDWRDWTNAADQVASNFLGNPKIMGYEVT